MIDIATLQALNAPTREERLENLQKAVQTASFPEANPVYINCHIHTTYSFSSLLPCRRCFCSKSRRVVHCWYRRSDTTAGAEEFIEAGKIADMPVTVGMEACQYGLHGRISNTPAETVSARGEWVGDRYCMVFEGTVRESMALGQRLVLRRKATSWLDSAQITVEDIISNESWYETPLLDILSYHFGFPLVSPLRKLISIRFPLSAQTMPPISVGSQTLMAAMLRPIILPNRSICSIYSRIMVSLVLQFKIRLNQKKLAVILLFS